MLKTKRKVNGDVVFTAVGRLEPDNVGERLRLLAVMTGGAAAKPFAAWSHSNFAVRTRLFLEERGQP